MLNKNTVMPVKTGIQCFFNSWIPDFAGMTGRHTIQQQQYNNIVQMVIRLLWTSP